MKRNVIYLALSMLFLVGCTDKFLDVENHNDLDEGSFFASKNDLQLAVNSAYCPLMHNGFFGRCWLTNFGTLDDRMWFETVVKDRLQMNTSDGDVKEHFKDCYRGIFRCSDIIKNLHDGSTVRPPMIPDVISEKDSYIYEAQLRTLRAMYYFAAVTLFRNPYFYNEKNEPSDPLGFYGNSDPELFWDQIDVDLKWVTDPDPDGKPKLPAHQQDWQPSDRGRMTLGAAWALWGKARLWKHYYYYRERNVEAYTRKDNGEEISRAENLKKAKECFAWVINEGRYQLQGQADPPQSQQDFLNALMSNTTYVKTLEGFGGKAYKGIFNDESVWEVVYTGTNRNQGGGGDYLPGWQGAGALNYIYAGLGGSYRNIEMDPEAYYTYETPEAGSAAANAGFDRDPRAYASMCFDIGPDHLSDPLDYRDGTIWKRNYSSLTDTKLTVANFGLYKGQMPFGTKAVGRKKYSYPQYMAEAELKIIPGARPPTMDPYNWRVIRFADVLLMYAEACYLSGSDGNAGSGLDALNRVRTRAGMHKVSDLTPATIIKERDWELMGEVFRFLDIIRWARDAEWYNAINFSQNYTPGNGFKENFEKQTSPDPNIPYRFMYMPMPQEEVDKNGGRLKQNPGW